eukprot:gnl/MRDRNA2_/MRDRNA2_17877_c0_seq1.p1 gnl/MRDRNA2_/MRDRNA2_17877_c0~~gnl/MRDRNA2_/MRDRNA2_17877_c0_seq1.p1  ORF type:complete len:518 (-),score=94.44 gnl/MRDRNA2_/MRDRNA2_17877_c0_seq1:42-1595(-)
MGQTFQCGGCQKNFTEAEKSKELDCSSKNLSRPRIEEYNPVHAADGKNEFAAESPRMNQGTPRSAHQASKPVPLASLDAASKQDQLLEFKEKTQAESATEDKSPATDSELHVCHSSGCTELPSCRAFEEKAVENSLDPVVESSQPGTAATTNGKTPGTASQDTIGTISTNDGSPKNMPSPKVSPRGGPGSPRTSPREVGGALKGGSDSQQGMGARYSEIGTASTTPRRKSWFKLGAKRKSTKSDDGIPEDDPGVSRASSEGPRRRSLRERLSGSNQLSGGSSASSNRPKSGNQNIPLDYMWLSDTLWKVTKCEAHTLGVADLSSNTAFTPLFFCAGGCPNAFCGMQAVMFSVNEKLVLDFWWVKPQKGKNELEKQTLMRHGKGPHKNDPGRSKAFYKPLGDLFGEQQTQGGHKFGIEVLTTKSNGHEAKSARAYFEKLKNDKERRYLSLIWQEDWTANPLAWSKYIKGKLIYQKDLDSKVFNACDYAIVDGKVTIGEKEEGGFKDVLPGNWVKDLNI